LFALDVFAALYVASSVILPAQGRAPSSMGLFTTILVLYFLLVVGNIFLRRMVEILPTFGNKRQAVDISQQIQEDISAYHKRRSQATALRSRGR
jgi:hypothetical protein